MSKNNYIVVKTSSTCYEIAYYVKHNQYRLNGQLINVPENDIERHKFFTSQWYFQDVFSVLNHFNHRIETAEEPYTLMDAKLSIDKFITQHQDEFPELLL